MTTGLTTQRIARFAASPGISPAIVLPFLVLTGAFLFYRCSEHLIGTLVLLTVVSVVGLQLVDRVARKLGDPNLLRLGPLFLAKLWILLFVLYAGWIPDLYTPIESTVIEGYDAQRYYFHAGDFAESGFHLDALPVATRYHGVFFYYGAIFAIAGHNPVNPVLVNALLTLLATLLLVRVGYHVKPQRSRSDWTLGLSMLVPEIIWYDAITSRESLAMALIVFATLAAGMYLAEKRRGRLARHYLVGAVLALLCLGLVRTTIMISATVVVIVMLLFYSAKSSTGRRGASFAVALTVIAVWCCAPLLINLLRSTGSISSFDYVKTVIGTMDVAETGFDDVHGRSVGKALSTSDPAMRLVIAPVRVAAYLTAPLPNVPFTFNGLVGGCYSDWQNMMTLASALLYTALLPLSVASAIETVQTRGKHDTVIFHLAFWITIVAIACGTRILHERYRVMAMLLFCGCAWLGRTANPRLITFLYACWLGLLVAGAVAYVLFKYANML